MTLAPYFFNPKTKVFTPQTIKQGSVYECYDGHRDYAYTNPFRINPYVYAGDLRYFSCLSVSWEHTRQRSKLVIEELLIEGDKHSVTNLDENAYVFHGILGKPTSWFEASYDFRNGYFKLAEHVEVFNVVASKKFENVCVPNFLYDDFFFVESMAYQNQERMFTFLKEDMIAIATKCLDDLGGRMSFERIVKNARHHCMDTTSKVLDVRLVLIDRVFGQLC